jgi:hypothetical protein
MAEAGAQGAAAAIGPPEILCYIIDIVDESTTAPCLKQRTGIPSNGLVFLD